MNEKTFFVPLLFLLLLVGCGEKKTKIRNTGLKIDSAKVEIRKFYSESSGYGKIEPVKSITLETKFDGIIKFPRITGLIKKGEIVYQLTGKEVENQKAILQKNFDLAKSDFSYFSSVFKRKKKLAEKEFLSPEAFDKYKHDYQNSKIKFEKAKKELSYFLKMISFAAPFNGSLSEVKVPQGADVKAGEQVAKFQNTDKVKLVAVFYGDISLLSSRNLFLDINGEKFKGNILFLERAINTQNGGHTVWIELNKKNDLIPGKYVNYKYCYNEHFSPAVPVKSVVLDKGNYFVVVAKNGKYEKRRVYPGLTDSGKVEIKKGLNKNEFVLTKGAFEFYYGNLSKTMNVGD